MTPRYLVALVALLSLPLYAAEKPDWPKKGDTMYVSADLETVSHSLMLQRSYHTTKACSPLDVKKVKEWGLIVTDRMSKTIRIKGEFRQHTYHTADECHAALKKNGQPDTRTKYLEVTFLSASSG